MQKKKKLFSSSYLQSQCDEQSRITKQQIIDNGDESAEAFTGLFSFIEHCLHRPALHMDLISQHFSITRTCYKCTGIFLTIVRDFSLYPLIFTIF